MKYLCLIYDDEKQWQKFPKEVQDKYMGEYRAFGESVQTSGHDVGANQLQPTHTAESGLELIDKILARAVSWEITTRRTPPGVSCIAGWDESATRRPLIGVLWSWLARNRSAVFWRDG